MYVLNVIFPILLIFLYIIIYLWIIELDKIGCNCSKLWHYNYIKIMSIILLVKFILKICVKSLLPSIFIKIRNYWIILSLFMIVSYMGILLDYIIKLKALQDECKCSKNWIREYSYYFIILYLSFLASLFVIYFYY